MLRSLSRSTPEVPGFQEGDAELALEPAALLAVGDQPLRIRVLLHVARSAKPLAGLAASGLLRPLVWCSALGREIKPLSLEEAAVWSPDCLAWDLVLPAVPAPATLEVLLGQLGEDGHVRQTLPLGAFLPLVTEPGLQQEIADNESVVGDLTALMEAVALGRAVAAVDSLAFYRGVVQALADFAQEEVRYGLEERCQETLAPSSTLPAIQGLVYLEVFVRDTLGPALERAEGREAEEAVLKGILERQARQPPRMHPMHLAFDRQEHERAFMLRMAPYSSQLQSRAALVMLALMLYPLIFTGGTAPYLYGYRTTDWLDVGVYALILLLAQGGPRLLPVRWFFGANALLRPLVDVTQYARYGTVFQAMRWTHW